MTDTVLFVDDEPNILSALGRQFLDEPFVSVTANNAIRAVELLAEQPISVIVSDNMMPGMSGIELLRHARERSPDTVRILLTAYADANAAIQAINTGEVYKFVSKPWDAAALRAMLHEALDRHHAVVSLRRADEDMLRSLAQTIELKDPYTRGHCDRVADYAVRISEALGVAPAMRTSIKHGSWLHDCGKIGVPESILNFNGTLAPDQMAVIMNHSQWGADVAKLARLSEAVVNVILYHHERFDGTGYPRGLTGDAIPLEARIVCIADVYDAMTTDRPYRKGMSSEDAVVFMQKMKGTFFDPRVFEAFVKVLNSNGVDRLAEIGVPGMKPG